VATGGREAKGRGAEDAGGKDAGGIRETVVVLGLKSLTPREGSGESPTERSTQGAIKRCYIVKHGALFGTGNCLLGRKDFETRLQGEAPDACSLLIG